MGLENAFSGRPWPFRRDSWWVRFEHERVPVPSPSVRLFGILCTWMEADVVFATVKNAFVQGCERVLLLDNDSPDETISEALRGGAELAGVFHTDAHDDPGRVGRMNDLAAQASLEDGAEQIWWLYLDADEFPHGPYGLTIREYLDRLDRRFRVVGSVTFDHYPSSRPGYLPGFHPIECQPYCEQRRAPYCSAQHFKHPLIRLDKGRAPLGLSRGYHKATGADGQLAEPCVGLITHHFRFREEAATRHRVEALGEGAGRGRSRLTDAGLAMRGRRNALDDVYAQSWDRVFSYNIGGGGRGVHPLPWSKVVDAVHIPLARWYGGSEFRAALASAAACPSPPAVEG